MSSLRTFSSAVSGSADDAATAGSWTHVSRGNNRSAGSWGTPTLPVAPAAPATRAFSFASAATAAALDDSKPMPPRAPSSRTLQAGPPPPKQTNAWSSARPAGAVAAAAAPKTVDIRSLSDFPSLGVPTAARLQRSYAMPWSTTVAEAAARDAPPSRPAAVATAASDDITADLASLRSRYRSEPTEAPAARRSRLANIGTRCFDDGPTDYTGPEEFDDDDGAGSYREEGRRADTPTVPESDELNAELGVSRRAGDKSDW